jgi:uncharacterized membrane protein YedE/YeeE
VASSEITCAGRGVTEIPEAPWRFKEVAITVTIGGSIALIVIGAILRFAITWKPVHVDLQLIGVILMIAGAVGLVIATPIIATRRRGRPAAQVYERRYTEPPP